MDSKLILITGANKGIGFATAKKLAELGHTVILTGRELRRAQESAKKITGKVIPYKLDVTSQSDIDRLFEFIKNEFGRMDVLINNAGIFSEADILSLDVQRAKEVFDTNVWGPFNMIQRFIPLLQKSADPRIINISSTMGAREQLLTDYAAYRLSKYTLNGLAIMLTEALKDSKIKINNVHPGWVKTDMGGSEAPRTPAEGAETPVWLATADDIPNGNFVKDKQVIDW